MAAISTDPSVKVSIAPLLKKLATPPPGNNQADAESIALAFSRSFNDQLNGTQLSSLLTLLCSTGQDLRPDVIARCAAAMRDAANPIDEKRLKQVLKNRPDRARGAYRGGICDVVGTGGDMWSTYNVSTTASIIASPLLAMAKHGNRAQTSMSGSADLLKAITPTPPNLEAVTPERLPDAYSHGNYAFLFAPNFHPGMRHAATVRRELGLRTIFNLLGPVAHPTEAALEARIVGVAYQKLGPIFTDVLKFSGVTKAMVVCGAEDLDEISCAGPTNCWWIKQEPNPRYLARSGTDDETSDDEAEPQYIGSVEAFQLHPSDFGLPSHSLTNVGGGKLPRENALILMNMLQNKLGPEEPLLCFVLINVAALLVISGICDADTSEYGDVIKERGPGGGRWKEGIRLARYCLESGKALAQLEAFIKFTNEA